MKKENRSNLVGVRLSDDELHYLDKLCLRSNLNRSDVMRMSLKVTTINRVDGFAEFTVQLFKIGNNLNQVTRVLNYNSSSGVADNLKKLTEDFEELKNNVIEVTKELCP